MTARKLTYVRDIHTGKQLTSYDPVWTDWESVAYCLATDLGARPDDFGLKEIETDEIYELVTLDGEPIAYLETGWQELEAVRAAVFPAPVLIAAE